MNRLTQFVLLLALVLGSGCASNYTKGRKTGLGLEMPAAGKSRVVFVRPSQFMGDGINFGVHDGERLIGAMPGSSYFVYDCEPGRHLFSSSMEDIAILEADLLADRIYYAKVSSQMGVWISRVNMYSLHPDCAGDLWPEMPKILKNLNETIVKPEAVTKDLKGATNYMQRLEKHLGEHRNNPRREQILPEHGQSRSIGDR